MLREGDMISGGFEINLGSSFAHKRDEILGQWRQNHIAAKGLHVVDKAQIVDPASLPDGLPMTMELRQAIAAARANAGKILMTRLPNGNLVFNNSVDYIKDPELDGIVAAPDWKTVGAHIDSLSAPPRYVPPVELASPGPERARELNAAFYAAVLEDALMGFQTCREFAAWWMLENSCLQRLWKPGVQEEVLSELSGLRHDFIDGHEGISENGTAKIFVVKAVVDLGDIANQGVTFRQWFANHLCRGIADYLDIALDGHTIFVDTTRPEHDVLVRLTLDNDAVLMDSKMYAAIGLANGEVIGDLKAAQVAVEDPTPLPHGIAVFKRPGGVFKEDHWAYGIRLKDIGKIAADEATKAHSAAVIKAATAKQALEDFLKAPQEPVLPEFAEAVDKARETKSLELEEALVRACAEEKELKVAKAEKTKLAKSGILEVTLSYTCVIDFADAFRGLRLTRNS